MKKWLLILPLLLLASHGICEGGDWIGAGIQYLAGQSQGGMERPTGSAYKRYRVTAILPSQIFSVSGTASRLSPEDIYAQYGVEAVNGTDTLIRGFRYSPRMAKEYYRMSGAGEATQIVQEAYVFKGRANNHLFGSVYLGAFFGVATGLFLSQTQNNTYGLERPAYAVAGMVVGATLGLIPGFAMRYPYAIESKKRLHDAGDSFNKYLKQQLKIGLGPGPNSAQGELTLNF
jgi:hypothetical protein